MAEVFNSSTISLPTYGFLGLFLLKKHAVGWGDLLGGHDGDIKQRNRGSKGLSTPYASLLSVTQSLKLICLKENYVGVLLRIFAYNT